MYNLTVYVKNECGVCDEVVNWFANNGVMITEVISVDEDPGELYFLLKEGFRQFPVVSLNHFNDVSFSGFELNKMEEIKEKVGWDMTNDHELNVDVSKLAGSRIIFDSDSLEEDNGTDTDGDILDKDWAKNRSREMRKEIKELRAILAYNGAKLKPERVDAINAEIDNLLAERDKITYKYGLAGERFNRLYEEKYGVDTDSDSLEENPERTCGPSRKEVLFRDITSHMLNLYLRKNADYGDSFSDSLDEDGLLVSKIRLKDKVNRFSQLIDNDALVLDESLKDTLIDLANYSVMTLIWMEEQGDE